MDQEPTDGPEELLVQVGGPHEQAPGLSYQYVGRVLPRLVDGPEEQALAHMDKLPCSNRESIAPLAP